MGQLIAAGVLRGCQTLGNDWGWRIPFAIQWTWAPFILIGTYFAPESPWWLVRKSRYEDARQSVLKSTTPQPDIDFHPDRVVAMIKHTNDLEESMHGGVNYLDCLKGVEKRRTLIACVVWLTQAWCGAAMTGFAVQIYREAGLNAENALNMNIGQYALGFVGTIISWFLMRRLGRRTLYVYGLLTLFAFLMVIGGLGVISRENQGAAWALGTLLMVYTLFYNFTVGPVCYAIVAEMPSTRLKIKTVVLARNVYNLVGHVSLSPRNIAYYQTGQHFQQHSSPTYVVTHRLELGWNDRFVLLVTSDGHRPIIPSYANLGSGFFYAGLTAILFTFMYFMLPETRNRTYGELDVLFENKVSARKFHKTNVDQFSGHSTEIRMDSSDAGSNHEEKDAISRQEKV